jgi:hypothetical protein
MSTQNDTPGHERRALAETLVLNRGALAMKIALEELFECWDKPYDRPPGLDCARAAANKKAIQNVRDALALATSGEAVEHILRNWREDLR